MSGFFSILADSILQNLPRSKNNAGITTSEDKREQIRNEYEGFVLHNVEVTAVDKVLKKLDVVNTSGIDQISAKFLKDGTP